MVMQSSQRTRSLLSCPGKGTPHWSQTRPEMKAVSRQQSAQSPKSL